MQQHLDLIPHQAQGAIIYQRPIDGYINATAMCRAAGREMKHYNENRATKEFLAELASVVGIPTTLLVQAMQGGDARLQGTWVHPQVAIHLGQWLSPSFAVQVTQWVYDWMSGRLKPAQAELPYHLRRHMANLRNVPPGHFSILVEMTTLLIAPMEQMGYTLPENMLPDISNGKMFCGWLRKRGVDTKQMPKYPHTFEDGRLVHPNAYPDIHLADWRHHFHTEWLPVRSVTYFSERDTNALAYLPLLLPKPKAA